MHCSFEELISTHTNGQLTLLMTGFSVLEKIRSDAIDDAMKKGGKPSNSSPAQPAVVGMKTSDLKKLSAAEHKRIFDKIGVGMF